MTKWLKTNELLGVKETAYFGVRWLDTALVLSFVADALTPTRKKRKKEKKKRKKKRRKERKKERKRCQATALQSCRLTVCRLVSYHFQPQTCHLRGGDDVD
jgi:hypothetical protein